MSFGVDLALLWWREAPGNAAIAAFVIGVRTGVHTYKPVSVHRGRVGPESGCGALVTVNSQCTQH